MSKEYLLEVKNITKLFPGTKALNEVKLQVEKGEVHALCGENGAGKSTLMNIIGGIFPPTSGQIFFEGKEILPKNPKEAQDLGIGFVHQELSLCPHLTAAENEFIGRLPRKGDLIDFPKLFSDSDEILSKFGAGFSSKELVSDLNVSEQQIVEIAKSISLNCKFLILDEPTSSLTDNETVKLFEIVKDISKQGISVLYISHRMAEIFAICDRVTVFKDGTYITTMDTKDITQDDIINAMVGREIENLYPPKTNSFGEEILKVEGLTLKGVFENISFNLRKGEILGFAGLVGAGRSEIMRSMCGIDPKSEGSVTLNGIKMNFKTYQDAVAQGVCYLTEDRKSQGLFLGMSIKNNMSSANLKEISSGMFIDDKKETELAETYVTKLNVKIPGVNYLISNLSGGNQQKCLVGKWLSINPRIIIMDEPTRGIDVGSKSEIHQLLRKLAEQGVGVIVVSSELPEVIGVSDRIAVIHEGHLIGIISGDQVSEESIMRLASG